MATRGILFGQQLLFEKLVRAREFRRTPTPAEELVWQRVRRNSLGFHFRRQQVIHPFIVDFYCDRTGLVVEVDGEVHELHREYDAQRDAILRGRGLTVIHFTNDEVFSNLDAVLQRIQTCCQELAARKPSDANGARPEPPGNDSEA